MRLPAANAIRQNDTHRLIPSRYSDGGDSVLTRIADDNAHLQDIFDLDHATNDRLLAERDRLPGIGIRELREHEGGAHRGGGRSRTGG